MFSVAAMLAMVISAEPRATAQNSPDPAQTVAPQVAQGGVSPSPVAKDAKEDAIKEDELKQQLQGKTLYLRGGYLDNNLSFDEHGRLIGHSPQGSYTLCLLQIDKVTLTKHKLELTGTRYGLHFLGALPNEDPTKASDKVRITPKKKSVKVTIDRELVVTPKKKRDKDQTNVAVGAPVDANEGAQENQADADAERAAMSAEPDSQRPVDPGSVTTTTSPAHAARLMRGALDAVFAPNLDDRMIAAMPSFWKLYYQAAAAQSDYRPSDTAILRQNSVDRKARIVTAFEPPSNDFAQACGIVGMALYHVVIGADGKPQEIVVGRPIGFGLDENAADSIRKASFESALKDGKPVPVMLDVVVQFRIYSKRTDRPADDSTDEASNGQKLPGPYSVAHP
ncbi:MAG TPA: energy transducer TonB [Terracidiphilus sp.]|nr:energy transducer TonB [Terracidiphilus sp.]